MSLPKKILVVSSILIFASVSPVLAQSPTPAIPTPEPGFNQSDFAKDVSEGEQSIENDNDGQNNQREFDDNEVDEGQQENENVHIDEQIDQDEAQNQEGAQGESQKESENTGGSENGTNTNIKNEDNVNNQ